jgi:hypothetical protein
MGSFDAPPTTFIERKAGLSATVASPRDCDVDEENLGYFLRLSFHYRVAFWASTKPLAVCC